MSTPLNLTHQQAVAMAGIVKDWLDEAAADLRAKRLHEADEKLQIAQADTKKLQAALAGESSELALLREIHAAWALANHVPSDAPGSWESQMMRKIERVLGIDTAPNLGELDAMPAGARKQLLGDVLRRMGATVNGAAA